MVRDYKQRGDNELLAFICLLHVRPRISACGDDDDRASEPKRRETTRDTREGTCESNESIVGGRVFLRSSADDDDGERHLLFPVAGVAHLESFCLHTISSSLYPKQERHRQHEHW